MPELPEVEAARRALEEHTKGKLIVRAVVAEDATVINGVSPLDLQQALTGKRIMNVSRKGKNMWLELDERPWPSFQFGMAGAVHIKGVELAKYKRSVSGDDEWPSKYSKVLVELEDGKQFSFTDTRRFARVRLLDDPKLSPPISELGPDAFLELLDEETFCASVGSKKGSIKALLLDQSFVSGIGNWVADEVLYQARIHPEQVASSLSKQQCSTLRSTIAKVLEIAIEAGAESSTYPENWIFHFREKKGDKASVDGHKIDFIKVGGRTSAYVPELQKLTGPAEPEKPAARRRSSTKKAGEESVDSDESPIKGRGKGGKKTKSAKALVTSSVGGDGQSAAGRKHATEDDDDDDDEEETSAAAEKEEPMKRGKPSRRTSSTYGGGGEQSHLEKNLVPGVVAAAIHSAVRFHGTQAGVGSGGSARHSSRSVWWPASDAGQKCRLWSSGPGLLVRGGGGFHRGSGGFMTEGLEDGAYPPAFMCARRRRVATCFIAAVPGKEVWGKGRVVSVRQGVCVKEHSLRACIGILKRPACFV